ncbi:glycosyltransferase family 2 protein [Membranicola marinus]|uniref:Glycosyltransferase family 2 protein n=1 Tax=Membranihabitans marinus TaxID=1227546 RepID=A0A953HR67_9BACT|nr:glycosyltransferase [Membranihabitans marinus]MBY5956796.1 glycosyltransferase family 2 protein [Membranihabitans marinus]
MTDPDVSIIIPHRNQVRQLQSCLGRLIELGYDCHDIIVVDNGSTDSLDFISDYPVQLLHADKTASPYIARNLGIDSTENNIIALLDVNALVEPGWMESALELLNPDTILGGLPHRPDPRSLDAYQRFDYLYAVIDPEEDHPIAALPATNLFFYKSLWTAIGPFREVRSLGDIEWTKRANESGYQLLVDPDVQFKYPFKSGKAFTKKYRRLGGGKAENRSVPAPFWYVFKNLLPPSPHFVRRMHHKNIREKMGLSLIQVIALCYWVKLNYGIGATRYWILKTAPSHDG